MSRPKNKQLTLPLWLVIVIIAVVLTAQYIMPKDESVSPPVDGELAVHFIDVGQGDAALIMTSDAAVLIDAGPNSAHSALVDYVSARVAKLDIMILTHPHEDHIGGASDVIKALDVKKIVMPDVTSTSATFDRLMDAIEEKDIDAEIGAAGSKFEFRDLKISLLAPISSEYDDMNNYSIVCRVDYGERSFLFTGDAESVVEKELLAADARALSADVLKVGHHGSNSSSTAKFLSAVDAKYAVISVGAQNDYGHPKQKVLDRLKKSGATIYRTDESGTIVATTNGDTIKFEKAG